MAHLLRLVFTTVIFAALIPDTARCERIVVIEGETSESNDTSGLEEQFRYELGIVLDRQEVLPTAPSPTDFADLPLEEKLKAAAALCDTNQAQAALWLEKSQDGITALGMLVTTPGGLLGRSVPFDNPMSQPADLALIAKELLEHSRSFAERKEAAADGWIPLPGDENSSDPASEPVPTPGDLGIIRDGERPGQRREAPLAIERRFLGAEVDAVLRQGIASFSGPSLYLGGEVSGFILPVSRLIISAGFGASAGPSFKQSGDRIRGFKVLPLAAVGMPFVFGNVGIDLLFRAAATYTKLSISAEGYDPRTWYWWSFSPDISMRISAPATRLAAFSFKLSFVLETNGKQIGKDGEPDVDIVKTPILSIQLAAGVSFSYFRTETPAPIPSSEAANR